MQIIRNSSVIQKKVVKIIIITNYQKILSNYEVNRWSKTHLMIYFSDKYDCKRTLGNVKKITGNSCTMDDSIFELQWSTDLCRSIVFMKGWRSILDIYLWPSKWSIGQISYYKISPNRKISQEGKVTDQSVKSPGKDRIFKFAFHRSN